MTIEFRVGIEEEGFVLNNMGFLAPYSYKVAEDLLNLIQRDGDLMMRIRRVLLGIQWEPDPSQIEYVTHPLSLQDIYDSIRFSRELLGRCAQQNELIMAFMSMHPIQSTPLPINGTHINISYTGINEARRLRQLNYVANYLRNYIPEIIAATSNTPIYRGTYNGYINNRLRLSKVLKHSDYSRLVIKPFRVIPPTMRERFRYGIIFEKIRRYIRRIEVNKDGDRLLDLTVRGPYTNIIEDIFKSPEATRIEIRLIDNQLDINYLNDVVTMLLGLTYEAIENYGRGVDLKKRDNLDILRERAIKYGVEAETDDGEKMGDKIKELIERIEPLVETLGLKFRSPLRKGIPEYKLHNIEILDMNPSITSLRLDGYQWMEIETTGKRKVIKLNGETKTVDRGRYKGMIIPEYSMEYEEENGILRRVKRIHIKYYLYTSIGYIELRSEDSIIKSLKPIERLLQVTERSILSGYQ